MHPLCRLGVKIRFYWVTGRDGIGTQTKYVSQTSYVKLINFSQVEVLSRLKYSIKNVFLQALY